MIRIRSPIRACLEGLEGFGLLVLAILLWPLCRRWLLDFGARREELKRAWAGDELLERADHCTTRAVSVDAPARDVWPWIVQIGCGRGAFHSYEWIERLGGIDVRNVESIVPAWQTLEIGVPIVLHPSAPPLHVARLEPEAHLCLRTWANDASASDRQAGVNATWSHYIDATSSESCRLLVRSRKAIRRRLRLRTRLVARVFEEPLDFVMEQRMLRTVRRLAEGARSSA